jgi:methionyl-tRNA formyltransferase
VPSLRALHRAGHEVVLVVTQPDRPAGRGMKVTPSAVKVVAGELGLPLHQPEKIRDPQTVERLRSVSPDFLVVVAYGQIIPKAVLDLPRLGAINVHASLLPRWRGAAPVAHAILAGDHETGVTIMKMDEQLDHGPILAVRATPIGEREDAAELTARLAEMGAELLVETLENFDDLRVVGQDHTRTTLAPKLTREMGKIDPAMDPHDIDRHVRALQPWPGVTLPSSEGRGPMKVLRGQVRGGQYHPEIVQFPGKKPQHVRFSIRDD